ncbi:hypothetical protein C6P45_000247 [Maudiozyma exigua]|uniref:Telomerase reverse transcriptase n=1 Tax=Maudiozyma exigua TaxID=34358 RepID=A0A9P6WA58_MAUEX|nr:hypothetical protein C6P45_000247 [Kazachstania exigua]
MQSLKKYIENIEISNVTENPNTFPIQATNINKIWDSYFIIRNSVTIEEPKLIDGLLDHHKTIDFIVSYLIENRLYNNVLVYGYPFQNNGNNAVSYSPHSFSTNFNVNRLKDKKWEMLHNRIGNRNFINLILNFTILEYNHDNGNFNQLAGNMINIPNLPPKWLLNKNFAFNKIGANINNKTFLYKNYRNPCLTGPLKLKYEISILEELFNEEVIITEKHKLNKQGTKFPWDLCFAELRKKCQTNINFDHFFNKIFKVNRRKKIIKNHLDNQVPVNDVIRFVILILEKLIPHSMYGSKKNKALIFSSMSHMLRLPINDKMFIEDILKKIQLKKMTWLGYPTISNSKKQFLESSEFLEKFLNWYFKILIPHILIYFFYCTEVSSDIEVLYFKREKWIDMVSPFRDWYFSKYLIENLICRNHSSYSLSEFNHSRLRIIPKKANNQFRMICVPNKGADDLENRIFLANKRKVIIPVQAILNHIRLKRNTTFEKVSSTMQISGTLKNFKDKLLKKYGTIPVLHFMKFDIDSCYDSIPRRKLVDVLTKLLDKEDDFLVRTKGKFNPFSGVFSTYEVVNGIDRKSSKNISFDKGNAKYLTATDVLSVVKDEIFRTVVWLNDKCYLRKDGLFQGSSLSGLLVDVLYDDMLLHYEEFKPIKNEDTLILRLADDFLIVSTSGPQIQSIRELINTGFKEYNAYVNVNKVIVESSQQSQNKNMQFCGLDISIEKLEIWKDIDTLNVTRITSLSSKKIFTQLEWFFNLRLQHNTIDCNVNSFETIIKQVGFIATNVSLVMVRAFKTRDLNVDSFIKYMDHIYNLVISRCSDDTLEIPQKLLIKEEILDKFLLSFLKYSSKYSSIISYLKTESKICKYIRNLCK